MGQKSIMNRDTTHRVNKDNTYMQTNTFNMLLVWSNVYVLLVELVPSTGVL